MKDKRIAADRSLLQELAGQEKHIWEQLQLLSGSMAERNFMLQEQGLFRQYRNIHASYLQLVSFKKDRLTRNEALKRALFLGWYQEVEPPIFTALADLDEDLVTEAYFALNKLMERGWLQDELAWMLAHYAGREWTILQHTENKLHLVTNWIRGENTRQHPLPLGKLPRGSMKDRGLMGRYFLALGVEEV